MPEKKRLLYFVEAMGGGVFTYIVDLANELVEKYDMYIAYAVRPQTPSDYEKYFDKRIHLIRVKNFERSISLFKDIKALVEIKKIAKSVSPDIIHLHSSKAGVLGRVAFNGKKIKLFYTPHGYSFLMQNQSETKRKVYKTIEKLCCKSGSITISCSKGEHEETLKLTNKALYVNNGINIDSLQHLIDNTKANRNTTFTVFTLGRICYQKNPDLFNEIAYKMPGIRFIWIGDGELKNRLTAPNIEITGWCERTDALRIALSADAFVLTSLWEGLPISLLEAMYMKKYCLVSNVIGNKDVIHDGINGFICNSAIDYVDRIKLLQSEEQNGLLEKAYSDVTDYYSTKTMANQYDLIYSEEIK